jgi:Protein of unknown function (DUF3800)
MPSKGWSWNLNRPPASRYESERLAKLLHPFNARVRLMAVLDLQAFIDESGTDAFSDIIILAGFLGPAAAWTTLEQGWLSVLTDAEVPFYHASEVQSRRPQKEEFRRLTRARRKRLTDDVTKVAADVDELFPFGVFVKATDWFAAADLIRPYLTPEDVERLRIEPFDYVYQVLAKVCVNVVIDNVSSSVPADEKVAFIFEDNHWKHAVLDGYDSFKAIHPETCRFGPIAFEPKIAFPGLQAADLLAWSYRRSQQKRLRPKGKPHPSFVRLLRGGLKHHGFHHMTRAALEEELNKALDWIASQRTSSTS